MAQEGNISRLKLRRTGGLIAGNELETSISPDQLDRDDASLLAEVSEKVDLADLAARSPIRGPGADMYQYELTLEGPGDRHQVIVQGGEIPPQLRALIEMLEARAEAERAGGTPKPGD
jgi:hypothetical protein